MGKLGFVKVDGCSVDLSLLGLGERLHRHVAMVRDPMMDGAQLEKESEWWKRGLA